MGAVVVLYQRWTHAPKIRARTPPAEWIPPAHWSQQNGCGPRAYECYLYDRWGNALYRMIGVDKEVMMKFFNPQVCGLHILCHCWKLQCCNNYRMCMLGMDKQSRN